MLCMLVIKKGCDIYMDDDPDEDHCYNFIIVRDIFSVSARMDM